MSGIDEQRVLSVCPECEAKAQSWYVMGDSNNLGVFNIEEEYIREYGLLNSSYCDDDEMDYFFDIFNAIVCCNCNHIIEDEDIINTIRCVIKESLK